MTRQQYLNELKYELRNLSVEEQEEALEYYRGYFDDANNDEEVFKEFGTPQELAQSIVSKFATVPEVKQRRKNDAGDGSYDSFNANEVRSLDISLGTAEIVMTSGDCFSVEYRGLLPGEIRCGLSPFGTLSIENMRKLPSFNFWDHKDPNEANHPRILIKVPNNAQLDSLRLHIGAGYFRTRDVSLTATRSQVDVGAGNLVLGNVKSGATIIRCGVGNLEFTGSVERLVKIDCGMGNVSLNLKGNPADYSIEGKVGLGSIRFNDIKKDGVGTLACTEQKENHFSVNCGMGSIKITMAQ